MGAGAATPSEAAKATGVARETVSRWQADPEFRAHREAATSSVIAPVLQQAKADAGKVYKRLLRLTRSDHPPTARGACVDVLKMAGAYRDAVDLRAGTLPDIEAMTDAELMSAINALAFDGINDSRKG
jgi:hypothetical protein